MRTTLILLLVLLTRIALPNGCPCSASTPVLSSHEIKEQHDCCDDEENDSEQNDRENSKKHHSHCQNPCCAVFVLTLEPQVPSICRVFLPMKLEAFELLETHYSVPIRPPIA